MKTIQKQTSLIVALDTSSLDEALRIAEKTGDRVDWFKVGKQLFCSHGPVAVKKIKEMGKKVFLDLKFHDIPNTVSQAVSAAAEIGADMVNVHASGGSRMMGLAKESLNKIKPDTLLIAVTVLTSMDDASLKVVLGRNDSYTSAEHVVHLAKLAKLAGLDGVVASAHEIELVKKTCGNDFILVIPGIRPSDSSKNDQKRVMTPAEAAARGANFIVVGRPITQSPDPGAVAGSIIEDLNP